MNAKDKEQISTFDNEQKHEGKRAKVVTDQLFAYENES
jgi:hypothetical protein